MDNSEIRYTRLNMDEQTIKGREVEYRTVSAGNLDVENTEVDQPRRFRGYAAVFNSPSEPLPFIETIRPGAFRRTLNSGREIRMFVNHNSDMVLGSTRSGTITLTEDEKGLRVEGILPDTSYSRDLATLMQRGDVHSMSFGFSIPRGGDVWSDDGQTRELREVVLHEISVITGFAAYPATEASVRAENSVEHVLVTPLAIHERLNLLYAKKA